MSMSEFENNLGKGIQIPPGQYAAEIIESHIKIGERLGLDVWIDYDWTVFKGRVYVPGAQIANKKDDRVELMKGRDTRIVISMNVLEPGCCVTVENSLVFPNKFFTSLKSLIRVTTLHILEQGLDVDDHGRILPPMNLSSNIRRNGRGFNDVR